MQRQCVKDGARERLRASLWRVARFSSVVFSLISTIGLKICLSSSIPDFIRTIYKENTKGKRILATAVPAFSPSIEEVDGWWDYGSCCPSFGGREMLISSSYYFWSSLPKCCFSCSFTASFPSYLFTAVISGFSFSKIARGWRWEKAWCMEFANNARWHTAIW